MQLVGTAGGARPGTIRDGVTPPGNVDIWTNAAGTYGLSQTGDSQLDIWGNGTAKIRISTFNIQCFDDMYPGTDIAYDLGANNLRWRDVYARGIDIEERTAPSGETDRALLYCVNNLGKTELYVIFQTGAGILLAAEV